jgi:diguanylate cyclase (GGDEF)-like protein
MYLWLPLSFLLLQAGLLLLPPSISAPVAYLAMVLAPLLTAAALWRKSERQLARIQNAWRLLALAVLLWAAGALLNFWHEWWQGRSNEMFGDAILMFQLFAVPVIYLIAVDPHASSRYLVRAIDGLQALALGFLYFLVTWSLLNERGAPDEQGVIALVWLIDLQTLCVTLGALVRWHAASEPTERGLYGAIAAFELFYLLLVFVNNHFIAGNSDLGPQLSSMATLAFALLAGFALRPQAKASTAVRSVNPLLRRVVYSACPMLLTITLIVVSLLLMRADYAMGVAGVAIGVLSYGLRSVLTQLRQLERGDALQHQHSQLEAIAWTDALTGVANRHFLEHTLKQTWLSTPPQGRAMAVLMIDVDHFKRLNDSQGHGVGDACLRQVASTLHHALSRPGDLLARYGGEEFIALLHDADSAGALIVAERLRSAVEQLGLQHSGGIDGRVSVSIGCAAARVQQESHARALIELADQALYAAKAQGRNRVAV